jgi:hypothetical protein
LATLGALQVFFGPLGLLIQSLNKQVGGYPKNGCDEDQNRPVVEDRGEVDGVGFGVQNRSDQHASRGGQAREPWDLQQFRFGEAEVVDPRRRAPLGLSLGKEARDRAYKKVRNRLDDHLTGRFEEYGER